MSKDDRIEYEANDLPRVVNSTWPPKKLATFAVGLLALCGSVLVASLAIVACLLGRMSQYIAGLIAVPCVAVIVVVIGSYYQVPNLAKILKSVRK